MAVDIRLSQDLGPVIRVGDVCYERVGLVPLPPDTPLGAVQNQFGDCYTCSLVTYEYRLCDSVESSHSSAIGSGSMGSGAMNSSAMNSDAPAQSSAVPCGCAACPTPYVVSISGGGGDPRCTMYTDLIGMSLLSYGTCQWAGTGAEYEMDLYCVNGTWHLDMLLIDNTVDCLDVYEGVRTSGGAADSPEGTYTLTPLSIGGCCSVLSPITAVVGCRMASDTIAAPSSNIGSAGSSAGSLVAPSVDPCFCVGRCYEATFGSITITECPCTDLLNSIAAATASPSTISYGANCALVWALFDTVDLVEGCPSVLYEWEIIIADGCPVLGLNSYPINIITDSGTCVGSIDITITEVACV